MVSGPNIQGRHVLICMYHGLHMHRRVSTRHLNNCNVQPDHHSIRSRIIERWNHPLWNHPLHDDRSTFKIRLKPLAPNSASSGFCKRWNDDGNASDCIQHLVIIEIVTHDHDHRMLSANSRSPHLWIVSYTYHNKLIYYDTNQDNNCETAKLLSPNCRRRTRTRTTFLLLSPINCFYKFTLFITILSHWNILFWETTWDMCCPVDGNIATSL